MKVQTEFEIEHFITHVSTLYAVIQLVDKKGEFYVAHVNSDTFEVHEDIIRDIRLKCQNIMIEFKIIQ